MRLSFLRSAGAGRWWRRLLLAALLGPPVCILLFRFIPVLVTPLMIVRSAEGYEWHHQWVSIDQMAPTLAHAVIASEDNLFCEEQWGFDGDAVAGQIAAWWHGERPRGASTITMQVAKNVFLWPGRDPVRKLIETTLTPQIALLWSKRRVLEVYLNSVEFGPGLYGVEAASQHYFNRHAAELTPLQAARLAVILPDPLKWSATHPTAYIAERTQVIEHRIATLGPLLSCVE